MAIGWEERGPFWVDGRITARVRGPASPGRIVRVRRPFALIGSHPDADIRVDDPAVDRVHSLLLLDRRGIFGVDLLTETGTRFAGAEAGSAWLGTGDILEIGGHRVELVRLRVDGRTVDPPLCHDDPLAPDEVGGLPTVILEPIEAPESPWLLGSPLAFLGRGSACAIRVEDDTASKTHFAVVRFPGGAYLIDLSGRPSGSGDRPALGASPLIDGEILAIGRSRFAVRVSSPPLPRPAGRELALRGPSRSAPDPISRVPLPAVIPPRPLPAPPVVGPGGAGGPGRGEILDAIRRLQAEAASVLDAQVDRIESLDREIAALRDEIRGRRGDPLPAPLRLELAPSTSRIPSSESATWLLNRLQCLEIETRSTWRGLVGRLATALHPGHLSRLPADREF